MIRYLGWYQQKTSAWALFSDTTQRYSAETPSAAKTLLINVFAFHTLGGFKAVLNIDRRDLLLK